MGLSLIPRGIGRLTVNPGGHRSLLSLGHFVAHLATLDPSAFPAPVHDAETAWDR